MPVVRIKVKRRGRSTFEILEALSESKLRRAIAPKAAFQIQKAVKQQFATERDPYGKRWKARLENTGKPILTGKTRNLRRNIGKAVTSKGFEVSADTDYASFHNRGTRNLPQRKIFPSPLQGLPRKWKQMIGKVARTEIEKAAK